ncbi:ubiquitin-activating enzyme E1 [Entamoeba marina]
MTTTMDESILNRQIYTIGKDAQQKMLNTKVFVYGLNGLGAELVKNIVLMSVKSVAIQDKTITTTTDLNSNFFLTTTDIGKPIDQVTCPKFQDLNQSLPVTIEERNFEDVETLSSYDVVVITTLLSKKKVIEINNKCRDNGVKFVYCLNRGIFSMIFNDFGNEFIVEDPNGEQPKSFTISAITSDDTIFFIDDDFVNLQEGDVVQFEQVEGMDGMNYSKNGNKTFVIEKRTSNSVRVGDIQSFGKYIKGGIMTEVKQPVKLNFSPIEKSLEHPGELPFTCSNKFDRPIQIVLFFNALMTYVDQYNTTPKSHDEGDWLKFKEILDKIKKIDVDYDEQLAQIFSYCNNGELSPLDTTIGGIAAQEVLKAASNKYTPYFQFMCYDCLEILPDNYITLPKTEFESTTRYSKQVDVIGNKLLNSIKNSSIFLVGSGAIGCEVIKTWALMGVATENGVIHVTDNDTIEKSNLSRQFLFRNKHINQPKSSVARESVVTINPEVHVKDYQLRVSSETENIFDDNFYSSLNVVTTALDNVQARLYVDSQCVLHSLSMIEAGTMGTKGNTQKKTIPMCTLHNYPSNIDHTIQWARDRFEGLFRKDIEPIQTYLESLKKDSISVCLEQLRLLYSNAVTHYPKNFKDCISWAKQKFDNFFYNPILKLITSFPKDSVTDEGVPFWHAPKRFPHVLTFDKTNEMMCDFIESATLLIAEVYAINKDMSREEIMNYCQELPLTPVEKNIESDNMAEECNKFEKLLEESELVDVKPIIFEKDDDLNHHVAFITACSNLRAANYDIEPADFSKTKFISGKIIPAMITTTAVVSGLQCIELYKVLQNKPLSSYQSSFLNLAIAYMDGAEPEPVEKKKLCEGFEVTVWTNFKFNGNCTIEEFNKELSSKYPFIVDTIAYSNKMMYCSYLPSAEKRLKQTFKEIYQEQNKAELTSTTLPISVSVSSSNADLELEEDFQFPDVILTFN